ncbi:hypothetical protein QNI19_11670 [Cytophagaceae bacterium DM2B3-1]|uniref:Lipoprotein n=1 Tax=Xanthocytophaga flava TaxID=3048013 RepID=A0ABT7CIM1_9BACT|nr:hypothetical protein [Xanthocytophaga flavus]MDJ1493592.1 hypothetical protein [Xanthocytophaga flavus]
MYYYKYFLLCLFLFFGKYTLCKGQSSEKDTIQFSPILWRADILGANHYRAKIVSHTTVIEDLSYKTVEEVEALLGEPDYDCILPENRFGLDLFVYIYQYEFIGKLPVGYIYKYRKSCNDSQKNPYLGSSLQFEFDKNTKKVTHIFQILED